MTDLLTVTDLGKNYGGIKALTGVNFSIAHGEHVAIVGDNGAGKSTLVRSISGVEAIDEGEMVFDGEVRQFKSPLEARNAGIETVYQDLALANDLDVVDNLFLGREIFHVKAAGMSILNRRAMRKRAHELLDQVGVRILNLSNQIRDMSGGQRQGVAIARAAGWGSKMIILDEPTAALGVRETGQVEEIIRGLKTQGVAVVLVSHNLSQVFKLADSIMVFRRGKLVTHKRKQDTTPEDIVAHITGLAGSDLYA